MKMKAIIFKGDTITKEEIATELKWGKKYFKREYPKARYSHYCLELTPLCRLRLVLVGDCHGKEVSYSIVIA